MKWKGSQVFLQACNRDLSPPLQNLRNNLNKKNQPFTLIPSTCLISPDNSTCSSSHPLNLASLSSFPLPTRCERSTNTIISRVPPMPLRLVHKYYLDICTVSLSIRVSFPPFRPSDLCPAMPSVREEGEGECKIFTVKCTARGSPPPEVRLRRLYLPD